MANHNKPTPCWTDLYIQRSAAERIIRNRGTHSYFVVMRDFGRLGREAVVDPELTRLGVISRLVSGEYGHVNFIHHIDGTSVEDVTDELFDEAEKIADYMQAEG